MTIKQVGVSSRYILIVDHNSDDAELLAQQLIQQGYVTSVVADFSASLKHLHRPNMTDCDGLEAMVADYIQAGCSVLAFSAGAIGRIQNQTYTFIAVQPEFEHLVPSVTIDLQDAFCGKVSESRATATFHHVGALKQMRCQPLYQAAKLDSYLGTPTFVDGDLFGSLCFFSTQLRPQGFENHEHEIIGLMAQSIGKFISVQQIEAKQRQAEEEVRLLLTLTQEIAIASDFAQALNIALRTLCEAMGWIYGEVWLPNVEETMLECGPIWYCKRSQTSVDAVIVVARDITERKQAEHAHQPTRRATVIIALTASVFEEDRAKVLAAGCNDFVRKPFRGDVILEKITEYLEVQYIYEDISHSDEGTILIYDVTCTAGSPRSHLEIVLLMRWNLRVYRLCLKPGFSRFTKRPLPDRIGNCCY